VSDPALLNALRGHVVLVLLQLELAEQLLAAHAASDNWTDVITLFAGRPRSALRSAGSLTVTGSLLNSSTVTDSARSFSSDER
jgi:hypothetical protein